MCFYLARSIGECSNAGSRSKTRRYIVSDIVQYSTKLCLEGTVEKGNITYNSKQISAYPADIILIVRNTTGLEAVIWVLEIEGRKM
jgi:hypothetical protein